MVQVNVEGGNYYEGSVPVTMYTRGERTIVGHAKIEGDKITLDLDPETYAMIVGPDPIKGLSVGFERVKEAPMGTEENKPAVYAQRTLSDSEIADRFGYHKGNETTIPRHILVRELFKQTARELDALLPAGRAKSLAFTELENAEMWANKAIAEMAPVVDESYG